VQKINNHDIRTSSIGQLSVIHGNSATNYKHCCIFKFAMEKGIGGVAS